MRMNIQYLRSFTSNIKKVNSFTVVSIAIIIMVVVLILLTIQHMDKIVRLYIPAILTPVPVILTPLRGRS